ncbi:hypothetical protein AVEN_166878-1 [Araneus ventricosus]|uniref:Neurotransmitter-gated ion-channel ligand-binding domain-containing protein n=1 Tax=Araneus ventricosus TaxID=182803 RepID=A0A4Y2H639_ARAVE|nr:hypothetical protein AVEN_166878-1 [Araneus ventricosus]
MAFYWRRSELQSVRPALISADFGLHGYYTTVWKDSRLVLNGTVVRNSDCAGFIWVPKVLFEAAESKEDFDIRENIIHINEYKIVHYSQRFGFRVGCKMFFKDYPFDTQFCEFPMKLLDAVLSNVNLEWYTENGTKFLILADEFKPLQFFLREPTALDNKEGISVRFVFVRQLMGSFINIFVPSTLIVAVSWVSFWIQVEAAPARVSLSVTSLLTLCTQVSEKLYC